MNAPDDPGAGGTTRTGLLRTIRVDPKEPDRKVLEEAAGHLRAGRLVAFPTETVYGLGADARDPEAVGTVFEVKGRPPDNPLIVHVVGPESLSGVARGVPETGRRLMERFWPGPLTIVLPADPGLPRIVTAGLDTVAVRSPAHPVARALLEVAGVPLAAPSANRSGMPSPTRAEHVAADFQDPGDRIALLLDAGSCAIGVESTVVDVTRDPPVILRLGGLEPAGVREVVPDLRVDPHARGAAVAPGTSVASPGMKHRHYAPSAPLSLYEGEGTLERLFKDHEEGSKKGKVGLIVTRETARERGLQGPLVVVLGSRDDPEPWAHDLFHALRRLDDQGVERILVEGIPETGLGATVMDRLRRAAGSP